MVAAARPRKDRDGTIIIRAINHLGHSIDLAFAPDLWLWASAPDDYLDSHHKATTERDTGYPALPPPGNGGRAIKALGNGEGRGL